jgi:hypothetical protein
VVLAAGGAEALAHGRMVDHVDPPVSCLYRNKAQVP